MACRFGLNATGFRQTSLVRSKANYFRLKYYKVMCTITCTCNSDFGSDLSSLRKLAHAIYRDIFCFIKKLKIFSLKILIFFFAQNIDCGYTFELPRRGGSNKYPQSIIWSKNKEKCDVFLGGSRALLGGSRAIPV